MSLAFAAVLLEIVAGVYFGFAVMKGSNFQQQVEFNVASLFGVAALIGIGISPWFLPAGYLARGLWDVAIIGTGLIAIWRWNGVLLICEPPRQRMLNRASAFHRADHGDDVGLHHAVDLGDLVQERPAAIA